VVQHLPQGLGLFDSKGSMDGVRMLGAWPWRDSGGPFSLKVWMALGAVLRIAAQLVSDLVGIFVPVAGGKYLATAQGEGILRTQAHLQGLTLGVAQ
jgi:hypothetical protein